MVRTGHTACIVRNRLDRAVAGCCPSAEGGSSGFFHPRTTRAGAPRPASHVDRTPAIGTEKR
ncbi:hypothetical protein [Halosolutus gelatinilyticus]|uniref:hypothetical protein n=1 Tax=Halosolutus gelatinilyticus TaxID=2931975 RepID=UPI001FF4D4AE|nr:hypothetical protein [Halosolutus gelatinilyticus]